MANDRRISRTAISAAISQALLAGAGLAGPAFAQETQAQAELAPVMVTATRREQDILDVPYNISAVSGDEIALRQTLDSTELLRGVAGVGVVDRGQRNAAVVNSIRIRGLNVDSSALGDYALSSVATVSTYVDDTPIFANFLLKDIQRVEVLRGPQGTLYGSGALGGTVRYVMNPPELGEFSGSVGGALSSVDGSDGTGMAGDLTLNVPVGDTLAIRLNLSAADYPGLTDYVNLYVLDDDGIPVAPNGILDPAAEYRRKKDADDVEMWYGRLAARWEPTDSFDATLSIFAQSDDVGGRRQQTPGSDGFGRPYRDYENGSIQLEPSTRDAALGALEMNLDLGFATLTSSTSYYDHSGDSTSENTGFYAQAGFLSFYYNYPRPMASAERTWSDKAFIQELRLVSDTGGRFDYVAGLWYQDQDLFSTQDSFLRGYKRWWDAADLFGDLDFLVTGDRDFIYRRAESFEDKAIYGELTWHATDRVHLTGGLRWFDNEARNDTFINVPLYASLSQPTNATFQSSEDDVLLKANVAVDIGDDDLFYATYSEGYRRGGSNAVPLEGNFAEDPAWQLYVADTVENYEVGVKGMLGGMRYDLSAFFVDWNDPQLNTATANWGFFAVINGESAESKGLELQLSGNLGDNVTYGFGWAYTDAELSADLISPLGTVYDVDGAALPGAPENSLNGSLDWRTAVLGDKEFIAHVDGYYQSSMRNAIGTSDVFAVDLDGFQLWNTAFTLAADEWSTSLWVKNIFNEEGVTGTFTELYMGTAPAIGYFGNGAKDLISLPRTIGVSFNYNF